MRALGRPASWMTILVVGIGVESGASPGLDGPERASRHPTVTRPTRADNQTFRPTVKIRKGSSSGTGSVIGAIPGEALILTAAHVIDGPGEPLIELHRYNLGVERNQPGVGWPKFVKAAVIAADAEADVALLRVSGLTTLPYVARLSDEAGEIRPGEHVVSVGVDLGESLSSWETRVRGVMRLNRGGDGEARPFLVTERAPEHGRSGGGLFRDDGRLVGVCVGRIEMTSNRAVGLFASTASIRHLLAEPRAADVLTRFPALGRAGDGPAR